MGLPTSWAISWLCLILIIVVLKQMSVLKPSILLFGGLYPVLVMSLGGSWSANWLEDKFYFPGVLDVLYISAVIIRRSHRSCRGSFSIFPSSCKGFYSDTDDRLILTE